MSGIPVAVLVPKDPFTIMYIQPFCWIYSYCKDIKISKVKPAKFDYQTTQVTMGDPLDHATGLEKRELLAKVAGNHNPFDYKVLKRGSGTKDCPNNIPSAFECRLVGCICEEESTSINWMWLHKGEPKRCECGYWFCLVHKKPL